MFDNQFNSIEERISCSRRQASVQAVRNAKHIAEDIARTVGLYVSKAVQIIEEHYQEKEGQLAIPRNGTSFQALLEAKTITVHVTLSVTFELKAKERHREHKK